MASRFSEQVHFSDWSAQQCVDLLVQLGQREQPIPFMFDAAAQKVLHNGFKQLKRRPGWANARDAESLYRAVKKARDQRLSNNLGSLSTATDETVQALHFEVEDCTQAIKRALKFRPVNADKVVDAVQSLQGVRRPCRRTPAQRNCPR
jgi:hypothetical protein